MSGKEEEQKHVAALPPVGTRMPLCTDGMIIRGRWRVSQQIGMGAFGEIYIAHNVSTREPVAIKVEPANDKKQALRAEVAIMKKLQGCPYVCQFISCGRQNNINFLVMELLGDNLSDLRKKQPRGAFSMATVCRLGCEMIDALQAVHSMGVMHRDVKPSNFVLGGRHKASKDPSLANKLFIIDFGLSRKYVGPDGEIKPPRANAGFRGTARYASVNSHQCKELAPRDDLWSIFYMMVEFATGSLPWRNQRDRDKVGEIKQKFMTGKKLTDGLPPEFEQFMSYLLTLDYYSKPDYRHIHQLFQGLLLRIIGLPPDLDLSQVKAQFPPFDWEKKKNAAGAVGYITDGHGAVGVEGSPAEPAKKNKDKKKGSKKTRSTEGGVGSDESGAADGSLIESGRSSDEIKPEKADGKGKEGGKGCSCSNKTCTLL